MTERSRGKRWNGANMKRKKLGSVSLDLVPGPDNPRNSEGAFLTLENGEILYAYSRYKGDSQADEATADLCLLRSGDDGRTFGEESIILTCEGEGGVNACLLYTSGRVRTCLRRGHRAAGSGFCSGQAERQKARSTGQREAVIHII